MAPMPGPATPVRRALLVLAAGVLLFAVAIAVPLVWTWWQGKQAQSSLEQAITALQDQDVDEAGRHVEDARVYADRAVATRHGLMGSLWAHLPLLSAAADDSRHMADSVDELTGVAETALEIYPQLTGDEGSLVTDGQVDLATLADVLDLLRRGAGQRRRRRTDLTAVEADAPLIGGRIAGPARRRPRRARADRPRPRLARSRSPTCCPICSAPTGGATT